MGASARTDSAMKVFLVFLDDWEANFPEGVFTTEAAAYRKAVEVAQTPHGIAAYYRVDLDGPCGPNDRVYVDGAGNRRRHDPDRAGKLLLSEPWTPVYD